MSSAAASVHPKGSIREMIAIALPMVVSHACETVMIFTDRLFLARLSPDLMNAAMGGGLTSFMLMSFFFGLIGYTTALVAQYLGAGKKENCAAVVTQSWIISLAAYPFILLSLPLAFRLFEFMGVDAVQAGLQKTYLSILLYGVIISLLRISLSGFFSGIGRTRVVMVASFTAMLANVALNYVFIFGKFGFPVMGIRGAAYGTVLGSVAGVVVLMAAYLNRDNRLEFGLRSALRFDRGLMAKLLRFGYPAGLEMFLNILAFNTLVMLFHSHGAVTATAATVMFNWDLVSFVPLIGVEIGVTSLVGRYMGARDPDTAHRAVVSGLKLGGMFSLFVLIMFVGFPAVLVDMFRPQAADGVFTAAVPLAVFMVRVASLYVLVEAVLLVFIGALRGAGDTLWAMRASVTLHWLMTGALFLILRVFGLRPEAGWVSVVFLFMVFSGIVYGRYRTGAWKNFNMVAEEPSPVFADGFHDPVDL